jgi:hypothetical protein
MLTLERGDFDRARSVALLRGGACSRSREGTARRRLGAACSRTSTARSRRLPSRRGCRAVRGRRRAGELHGAARGARDRQRARADAGKPVVGVPTLHALAYARAPRAALVRADTRGARRGLRATASRHAEGEVKNSKARRTCRPRSFWKDGRARRRREVRGRRRAQV